MAKQARTPRAQAARRPPTSHDEAAYVRFSRAQRIEHIVLLVSFTTLAVTGLPQKFAGNGVAEWFIKVLGGIEPIRTIHHTSAMVFILMSVYDVVVTFYKIFVLHTELSMLPGLRDVTDAVSAVRFNLGLSKQRPKLPRYSYEEKAEYWAMVWGTVVMAATGFMLWNPILFTKFFPGELIPAAKAAHGAEALLAVLAIIVWHFYNVHLKSFNTSMWTGKLSEHHMAEEHGAELESIQRGEIRPRPTPEVIRRRMRVFAPVAAVAAFVLVAGLTWLATAETTAITTVPTPAIKAFVPLPPTISPKTNASLSNAQIGKPIPHPVAGREQCDTCHGPKGVMPYPAGHAGRPNISCQVCHSPDPRAAAATPAGPGQAAASLAVKIPHPIEGRADCLMCHKDGGILPEPADHFGRTNQTCTACHSVDPGISGTPVSAQTPAVAAPAAGPKAIPADHAGRGPSTCVTCHAPTSSIKPAPKDHEGRGGDTCQVCHQPAAAGTTDATPVSAQTPAAATPAAPAAGGPKAIPADHTGRASATCVACHAPTSSIKPAPVDHEGRTGDTCAACHKAADATSGAAPTGAPSGAATPAAPAAGGPKAIPADHAGRASATCTACHAPTSSIKPAPVDHEGRTGDTCATCHKPLP